MERIAVTLLGSPSVEYGGENVLFPYKKAEGLFYYLCVKKKITRNEAIEIFWSDCDNATAKKNLRNAIYNIRKIFGTDIITVSGTTIVGLNPARNIFVDMDELSEDTVAEDEFLHFFYIKDCYEFEKWVDEIRESLKSTYLHSLKKQIAHCQDKKDSEFLEKSGLRLLREQIWDEELHRELLSKMAELGNYQAAINQYQHLTKELETNLGVLPESQTEELYLQICDMKSQVTAIAEDENEYFYGRENMLYHIFSRLNECNETASVYQADSFLITGEAGVGKSVLMKQLQKMLEDSGHLVFTWSCWEADMYLWPWYGLIRKIETYCRLHNISVTAISNAIFSQENSMEAVPIFMTKMQYAIEAVLYQLMEACPGKRLVIFFDELQWMDEKSIHLLGNIIFRMAKSNLSIVAAYRGVCWHQYVEKLSNFQIPLIGRGMLETIELQSFSREETAEILKQQLGDSVGEEELNMVYENTGGNAHFLMEMISAYQNSGEWQDYTVGIDNIIKSRLMRLDDTEKAILDILAVCPDKESIEELIRVKPEFDMNIAEGVESLLDRKLIAEELDKDGMYLYFRHLLVKKYVLRNLSESKKYLLYAKIKAERKR